MVIHGNRKKTSKLTRCFLLLCGRRHPLPRVLSTATGSLFNTVVPIINERQSLPLFLWIAGTPQRRLVPGKPSQGPT